MIKLIASDVDGTLLKEESQNLNPNIYDIIRQLKEMDIHFIAASGRQYYNLRNIFAPVQDDISYIAENGSLCISDGKVISRGLIDRELGLRIFRAIKEYGNCHCLLSCESTCYVESTSTAFIDHVKNGLCYNTCVVDDLSQIQEPFLKIAVCDYNGTDDIWTYCRDLFSDEIKVVTSGYTWIDFIAPNANKGSALAELARHFNVKPEECMTFGDQYNDAEMLQFAGISYAMNTGAPGISNFATYTTDSVEKVLYGLLDKLIHGNQ